jgi:hypothetical protein
VVVNLTWRWQSLDGSALRAMCRHPKDRAAGPGKLCIGRLAEQNAAHGFEHMRTHG